MRLELTKKTEMAARALMFLVIHSSDRPLKGPLLAEWLETSVHNLPHVMKPLVDLGWVTSETGPTGGYVASEAGATGTMFDLIERVEGPFEDGRCVLREAPCPAVEQCGLHSAWSRARSALIDELRQTRVVDGAAPVPSGQQHQKGDNQ
jgi:Rrf2 family protein